MAEFIATYDDLFAQFQKIPEPKKTELMERMENCKRLGMKDAVQSSAKGVISAVLATKQCALLEVVDYCEAWGTQLGQIMEDGAITLFGINRNRGLYDYYWKSSPLAEYSNQGSPVPVDVLRRIPDESKDEARVFYQAVDPVIAYEIRRQPVEAIENKTWWGKIKRHPIITGYKRKGTLYVGIFKWE